MMLPRRLFNRLPLWLRRRILHWRRRLHTIGQFENPKRSFEFMRRLHSPWIVLGQWGYNIAVIVLLAILFGLNQQFSDYLNARGDYRNRQQEEQKQYLCELISNLRADTGGQLQDLADSLGCLTGPRAQPGSAPATPIAPSDHTFTGSPTPSSSSVTGAGAVGQGAAVAPWWPGVHGTGSAPATAYVISA